MKSRSKVDKPSSRQATRKATKLIIIRGPSGVGKSTVSKLLLQRTSRPAVLVDLDHYRFGFVNPPRVDHGLEYRMSASAILTALRSGFDVIFDGQFTSEAHDPFLARIFRAHPRQNYLFYLDASLPETLARHSTKFNPRIGAEKMAEVYPLASPLGRPNEVVVPEGSTLEQTISLIRHVTGI